MIDPLTICAVAFEVLHQHEALHPEAIARAAQCTVPAVLGALAHDERFQRTAGRDCWWWKRSGLPQLGLRRRRRRAGSDADLAASVERERTAAELVRRALAANPGGANVNRIAEQTTLPPHVVLGELRALADRGEATTYTMSTWEFWKAA